MKFQLNYSALRDLAKKNLEKNRRIVQLGDKQHIFHCPSPTNYPFQWFWDSCFHAVILASLDGEHPNLAKEEIRALLAWQRPDGFIPHVIFWDKNKINRFPWHWNILESKPLLTLPKTTELIQPPMLGIALERMWQRHADRAFLEEILPPTLDYYKWLFRVSDHDKDGLISIIAPFESGLDFSPEFDEALGLEQPNDFSLAFRARWVEILNKYRFRYNRSDILRSGPFVADEVMVNTVASKSLKSLSGLLREIGADSEAKWAKERAIAVKNSLIEHCYDSGRGAFFGLYGPKKKRFKTLTISALMPLIIDDMPDQIIRTLVDRHLTNDKEFFLPFPFPSVAASERQFSAESLLHLYRFLWRGSTWGNMNWFFSRGLKNHGYSDLAAQVMVQTAKLIKLSGLREYYNPYTGEGFGAKDFTWFMLILDMI